MSTTFTVDECTKLKNLYLQDGLSYISRLIELADRNSASSTYGCFDRGYWHYRTADFPSGMYQEAVLPLALAFALDAPANPFYENQRVKELAIAGIHFAGKSSHRDGSCDDYFPFERASGATAFSLYACTEAALILNLKDHGLLHFFKKRGTYLAESGYEESGVLSNHKALMALAIFNVYLVAGDTSFKKQAEEKIEHLLSLQTSEGWFPEYEGCDPGYLTFTIDFLAKYFQKSQDSRVIAPLNRAIEFASYFLHPDGSYGGEYGSRNTFHFLPHGFELMAQYSPFAVPCANQFLRSIESGTRSRIDDDRIFIHYVYNYLMAYRDFCEDRTRAPIRDSNPFVQTFSEAGMIVIGSGSRTGVFSVSKGGAGKIFSEAELLFSDAGIVGETQDGIKFTSQVLSPAQHTLENELLTVEGRAFEHRDQVFTPFLFWMFRTFLVFVARFLPPNIVRRFLQRKTITKKKKLLPLRYTKRIVISALNRVEYTFYLEDSSTRIKRLWIGSDPTFIYVATSQPFQPGSLKAWIDLSPLLPALNQKRTAFFALEI